MAREVKKITSGSGYTVPVGRVAKVIFASAFASNQAWAVGGVQIFPGFTGDVQFGGQVASNNVGSTTTMTPTPGEGQVLGTNSGSGGTSPICVFTNTVYLGAGETIPTTVTWSGVAIEEF
jgi:hypothetical protein